MTPGVVIVFRSPGSLLTDPQGQRASRPGHGTERYAEIANSAYEPDEFIEDPTSVTGMSLVRSRASGSETISPRDRTGDGTYDPF
jgi:hypothetical protein